MTEISRTPPRDDAELAARIEQATRPEPLAPSERTRFAARVRERVESARKPRWRWLPMAALGTAAVAVLLVLALRPSEESPAPITASSESPAAAFADSWQEELLYAPEWIESDDGFVDDEVLPADYAVAAALLDS